MGPRRLLLLIAIAVLPLVAAPGTARAGGFATVGLSWLPDGPRPGAPWRAELTVLQHGRTPLAGLRPQLTIRSGDSVRVVSAAPAGREGRYRALVRFPHAGRWTVEVNDGFRGDVVHRFPPVRVTARGDAAATTAPPAVPSPPGREAGEGWLAGGIACVLAALAVLAADRRRRHPPGAGQPA